MSDNEQKNERCETIADVIAIVREIVKFYERVAKMSKGAKRELEVALHHNLMVIVEGQE